jgi:hypothetical protein
LPGATSRPTPPLLWKPEGFPPDLKWVCKNWLSSLGKKVTKSGDFRPLFGLLKIHFSDEKGGIPPQTIRKHDWIKERSLPSMTGKAPLQRARRAMGKAVKIAREKREKSG